MRALGVPFAVLVLALAPACGRGQLDPFGSERRGGADGSVVGGDGTVFDTGTDGGRDGGRPDVGDGGEPRILKEISISPPSISLILGARARLVATGLFSDGSRADVTAQAQWSSDSRSVSVSGGLATALSAGAATIRAEIGPVVGTARVQVSGAELTSIEVSPAVSTAPVGVQVPFTAVGILTDGSRQDLTASVEWLSSDPGVADIQPGGLATTRGDGQTTIIATFGNLRGSAILDVTAALLVLLQVDPVDPTMAVGAQLLFRATGIFSDMSRADLTQQVAWRSDQPSVVRVDGPGVALALAPGQATITAELAGLSASSRVTVSAAPITALRIEPGRAVLIVGGQLPLRAIGTFADGSEQDLTDSARWSVDDPSVAAIGNGGAGQSGLLTGLMGGMTLAHAEFAGLVADAGVVVTSANLIALVIIPPRVSLSIGATTGLTAIGTFSDGSRIDVTADVAWSSDDRAVATVNAGQVTAQGSGQTTIRASLDGQMATALVDVGPGALTSIDVQPANAMTTVGLRTRYTAMGTFSDGRTADLSTSVTWTTGDTNLATISNVAGAQGQLLARAAGVTTVNATFMGITGSTRVLIGDAGLVSLTVAPIAPSVAAGTPVQFTATAIFSNGTQQNVTQQSAWSSSNPSVAVISPQGQARTLARGTTTIEATFMGVRGSTTLRVTDAVIVSISVSPALASIIVGGTQPYSAQAIFSDGTQQPVTRQATWQSSDSNVAQIGSGGRNRGVATGVSAGTVTITATFNGVSGTASLTVTSAQLISIQLTPFQPTLIPGDRVQMQAVAVFSDGTQRNVTGQATWVSTSPNIAAVSTGGGGPGGGNRGLVTGISPGMATISATFMGVSGTTQVTVTMAAIVQIQLTPFVPRIPVGLNLAMRATAFLSDGSSQDITLQATWTSDDPAIAAVSTAGMSRGLVTGVAPGVTTIRARFLGAEGTALVTVSAETLRSIDILPGMIVARVGEVVPLTAQGRFSGGTVFDLTNVVLWQTDDAAVAQVSNALGTRGQLTAMGSGSTQVRADLGGVSGVAGVFVP